MLLLKPNCELCDTDLPPGSDAAMICSYECTFCRDCVTQVLENVCPNCGGGLMPRPIRPRNEYRPGVGLPSHPASQNRVISKYSQTDIREFAQRLKHITPLQR